MFIFYLTTVFPGGVAGRVLEPCPAGWTSIILSYIKSAWLNFSLHLDVFSFTASALNISFQSFLPLPGLCFASHCTLTHCSMSNNWHSTLCFTFLALDLFYKVKMRAVTGARTANKTEFTGYIVRSTKGPKVWGLTFTRHPDKLTGWICVLVLTCLFLPGLWKHAAKSPPWYLLNFTLPASWLI